MTRGIAAVVLALVALGAIVFTTHAAVGAEPPRTPTAFAALDPAEQAVVKAIAGQIQTMMEAQGEARTAAAKELLEPVQALTKDRPDFAGGWAMVGQLALVLERDDLVQAAADNLAALGPFAEESASAKVLQALTARKDAAKPQTAAKDAAPTKADRRKGAVANLDASLKLAPTDSALKDLRELFAKARDDASISKLDMRAIEQAATELASTADAARQATVAAEILRLTKEASKVDPCSAPVWVAHAQAALVTEAPDLAWQAGRALVALGEDNSDDGRVLDVLAGLKRRGWLVPDSVAVTRDVAAKEREVAGRKWQEAWVGDWQGSSNTKEGNITTELTISVSVPEAGMNLLTAKYRSVKIYEKSNGRLETVTTVDIPGTYDYKTAGSTNGKLLSNTSEGSGTSRCDRAVMPVGFPGGYAVKCNINGFNLSTNTTITDGDEERIKSSSSQVPSDQDTWLLLMNSDAMSMAVLERTSPDDLSRLRSRQDAIELLTKNKDKVVTLKRTDGRTVAPLVETDVPGKEGDRKVVGGKLFLFTRGSWVEEKWDNEGELQVFGGKGYVFRKSEGGWVRYPELDKP